MALCANCEGIQVFNAKGQHDSLLELLQKKNSSEEDLFVVIAVAVIQNKIALFGPWRPAKSFPKRSIRLLLVRSPVPK